MADVQGTIAGVPEVKTHQDAPNKVVAGTQNNGQQFNVNVMPWRNTGNVAQTVTLDGVTNLNNCTLISSFWRVGSTDTQGASAVVPPGADGELILKLQLASLQPGSADTAFGCTVNCSWS